MGGVVSCVIGEPFESYWSEEEQIENERSVVIQKKAVEFVENCLYVDVPIKVKKQSLDPSSPLWIELDHQMMSELNDAAQSQSSNPNIQAQIANSPSKRGIMYNIPEDELARNPTGVLVDKKGNMKIIFDTSVNKATYPVSLEDFIKVTQRVKEAKASSSYALSSSSRRRPRTPKVMKITTNSISLDWGGDYETEEGCLPWPIGIIQEVFVERATISAKSIMMSDANIDINRINNNYGTMEDVNAIFDDENIDLAWVTVCSKQYQFSNFTNHEIKELKPGTYHIFRLKFRDVRGWSEFSLPSPLYRTLPDKPAICKAPKWKAIFPDAVHLLWEAPNDNGEEILCFSIKARSVGDTGDGDQDEDKGFVTIYSGGPKVTSYLITGLYPTFAYSFCVTATNSIGTSDLSGLLSLTLPPRKTVSNGIGGLLVELETEQIDQAESCPEAWREYFDTKTQQYFYFNRITARRTTVRPQCLGPIIDFGPESPNSRASSNRSPSRQLSAWKATVTSTGEAINTSDSPVDNERKMDPEIAFRKKRYRLMLASRKGHQNRSPSRASSSTIPSTPSSLSINTDTPISPDAQAMLTMAAAAKASIWEVEINRKTLVRDGYRAFMTSSGCKSEVLSDLLRKRLKIKFFEEEGIDSGGPSKEFFLLLSAQAATKAVECGYLRWTDGGGYFFAEPSPELLSSPSKAKQIIISNPKSDVENNKAMDNNVNSTASKIEDILPCSAEGFAYFLGRLIGKALYDRQLLDLPLSEAMLRCILGYPEEDDEKEVLEIDNTSTLPDSSDLDLREDQEGARKDGNQGKEKQKNETVIEVNSELVKAKKELKNLLKLDKTLHTSLTWMLNNDITGILEEKFGVVVWTTPSDGHSSGVASKALPREMPLCKGGLNKEVTEANKYEYVRLRAAWATRYGVERYSRPFMDGLSELIPAHAFMDPLINLTTKELEIMLNGKSEVDIEEIRAYTIFQGTYDDKHLQVVWFWQALQEMDEQHQRGFLRFVTGTSRVPLDGYDPPFNITEAVDIPIDGLPRAHTCFNQIALPTYSSLGRMKIRLEFAIENCEGFNLT